MTTTLDHPPVVPQAPAAIPPAPKHQNALQRGLHDGWQAFTGTVKVVLVVFGVVLPFAVLIAVLWWPVRRLVRATTRLRARFAPSALPAQSAPSAPSAPSVPSAQGTPPV